MRPIAASTGSHRVLFITELLDIIFSFLDRDSNVTNACVCKRWSDIALDVVWKEVDDLLHLFRLLKPICHQPDTYEYVSNPCPYSEPSLPSHLYSTVL